MVPGINDEDIDKVFTDSLNAFLADLSLPDQDIPNNWTSIHERINH
jgi:hypothetical protein